MNDGLVCCAVGEAQYAFRGADVRHIVRVEKMRGPAGTDGRAGTLEAGGQPVPVFRLGDVLGRPGASRASQGDGHHIAVTGERSDLVGWLVDRIVRTTLSENARTAPLPALVGLNATMWCEALVTAGDGPVLLLSPQYLNPLAPRPVRSDVARPFCAPAHGTAVGSSERVILLFSTPALPYCSATRFALSARRIAAITQPMSTLAVPGCAPHVTGVAWWRNAVVPVIDFRGAGDHDDAAQRRRYLIAQCGARLGGSLIALPVDPEIAMHRPDAADRQVVDAPCPAFAAGMFDINGETVALVDLDALLAPAQADAEGFPA